MAARSSQPASLGPSGSGEASPTPAPSLGRPFRQVIRCLPASSDRYRTLLTVQLAPASAPALANPRHLVVLLKNPSRADATRMDPTVGKVEAWARRRGFALVSYVNLFALRSPHPAALNRPRYQDAVGPENDRAILTVGKLAGNGAGVMVVAWGNPNGVEPSRYARRIQEALRLLAGVPLFHVGPLTRQGQPRHGLHWQAGMELSPFSPLAESGPGAREPS